MNGSFRFDDARAIVEYLDRLGVSDIYSAPILKARPGSMHGYDVVDPDLVNPELGTRSDFEKLTAELRGRNMGLLLDIVPNHMAASPDNSWWASVLENGPASRYIHFFDIDTTPSPGGNGEPRISLPILGRPYGEALEAGELKLGFDENGFHVAYWEHRFPLATRSYRSILEDSLAGPQSGAPRVYDAREELRDLIAPAGDRTRPANSRFLKQTLWRLYQSDDAFRRSLDASIARLNGTPGKPASFDALDRILEAQYYRLSYWRVASEAINYRRFFDIADLIGVRVEEPEVFEARHAAILAMVAEGHVTGLRIDHIDGLYDPVSHLRRLQSRTATEWSGDPRHPGFYVVVEKILALDETLPEDFTAHGTTGYDSLNFLNAISIDLRGLESLGGVYHAFVKADDPVDAQHEISGGSDEEDFDAIAQRSKRRVIEDLFSGEMRRLGAALVQLAASDRDARDFPPREVMTALVEVTASLPVYRTYTRSTGTPASDRAQIEYAVAHARSDMRGRIDPAIFAFIRRVLLVDVPRYAESSRSQWLDFVMRWQQFTGRVTAKGLEDTAFYVYNRLLSLNEVGGEPGGAWIRDPVEQFHDRNAAQLARWPGSMNATSTHDTKRSEDFRARLNVLSEMPEAWGAAVDRWSRMNETLRRDVDGRLVPDRNEEIHIYQTLLGMWPHTVREEADVPQRIRQYLEKAAREAKVYSSWLSPDPSHEEALVAFATGIIAQDRREFLDDFHTLQRDLAWYGHLNSLAHVVMKIAMPGVPDFYQGSEMWDFSVVDPDNRRPVDWAKRADALRRLAGSDRRTIAGDLLEHWPDGRVKLFTTWRALEARRRDPDLFLHGAYVPLHATARDEHLCAFARVHEGRWVVAVVPRLVVSLAERGVHPLGENVWLNAAITLPDGAPQIFENAFTSEPVTVERSALSLARVFGSFPVAILTGGRNK
ncbi:MAG: malto-oligosyltrehalose synthase [Thermoanaerobaculia bacterium]